MSTDDPLDRRRRRREATWRRNLSIAFILVGLMAAGLIVTIALLIRGKVNQTDGDIERGNSGNLGISGSGNGTDKYLFEMASAWDRASAIRASRAGKEVAVREGDEAWMNAVKSQTGRKIDRWPVRLSRIVEDNGVGGFIEASVVTRGSSYRIFLSWAGPLRPLEGHEGWLTAASQGDPAIVSGTVAKMTAEEGTWFGDLAGSIDKIKGRQMILRVELIEGRISKPEGVAKAR